MTIYHYRCTSAGCRKRVRRKRLIETYVHERFRVCPECGGNLSLDPEVKRRHKREKCTCDGLPWPHREGSVGCRYYKGPIDDEYEEHYYTLICAQH